MGLSTQDSRVAMVRLEHLRAVDFWSLVDIGEPDECWRMKGHVGDGYPIVAIPRRILGWDRVIYRACRAAVALDRGRRVPHDMTVDHLCFNPPCVNPKHLDVVTQAENIARRRGRWGRGEA